MLLKIDHHSKIPLHVQVEELLRNLVIDPEFQNGAFLPREVELANRLGVSRNTIRQATNKLQHEGLLIRKKGVGTKVAQKKPLVTGLNHWYSFTHEMQALGIHVVNLVQRTESVPANKKLADFFNIDIHTQLLKLSKLKGTDEGPIVYFESFFNPRLGVSDKDEFSIPLYQMLEDKYGVVVERSLENISSVLAGPVGKLLDIKTTDPILFRERFVFDVGNRPIEYNLGHYRSDRFSYSIDIKKN